MSKSRSLLKWLNIYDYSSDTLETFTSDKKYREYQLSFMLTFYTAVDNALEGLQYHAQSTRYGNLLE